MKKILVLIFLGFCWNQISAQGFSAGVKLGANFSKFTTDVSYKTIDYATAYHGGLFTQLKFAGFLVQPEILFNQRKGSFTFNVDSISTIKLYYVDVPILFGYSFLGVARAYAGPNFTFLVSAVREADFNNPNYNEKLFNSAPIAGVLGVGVDISKITLDFRFDFSITKIGEEAATNFGKIDFGKRVNMFQVSVGYKFVKL